MGRKKLCKIFEGVFDIFYIEIKMANLDIHWRNMTFKSGSENEK